MSKWETWKFWVLAELRDGKPTHLKAIYTATEARKGTDYINPLAFNIEPIPRAPKYKHRVRSTLNSLTNQGFIKHLGKGKTGRYCITDAGMSELSRIEP
jgi:DNA-binding PadR family transcriptional regulator